MPPKNYHRMANSPWRNVRVSIIRVSQRMMHLTGTLLLLCAFQFPDFGLAHPTVIDRQSVDRFLELLLGTVCERHRCVAVDSSCTMNTAVLANVRASVLRITFPKLLTTRYNEARYRACHVNAAKYIVLTCMPELAAGIPALPSRLHRNTQRVRNLIENLGLPFTEIISVSLTSSFSIKRESFEYFIAKPYAEYFAVFLTDVPELWASHSQEFLGRSEVLDFMFSTAPTNFTRFSSIEKVVNQAIQPTKLHGTENFTMILLPFANCRVKVSLETSSPNQTISLYLRSGDSGDIQSLWIDSDHMAVIHIPIKAMARVPMVGKTVQVAKNIAFSTLWLALLATGVAVALFQDKERTDFFLKLICSLWTPVEFRCTKKVLPFALWILFCQTFSVYFRGNITSSLHALPRDRVRSIRRCEHFKYVEGEKKRGKMGYHVAPLWHPNDLLHFVRGGILCQDESYLSLLKQHMLINISTYEVRIDEPQHRFNDLRTETFRAVDSTRPQGMQSITEVLTRKRCCLRLAQRLRAHAVVRDTVGYRSEHFATKARQYMAKPLSSAHGEKYCEEGISSKLRCVSQSDLQASEETASADDLWLHCSILAVGSGVSLIFALIEWLLARCRSVLHWKRSVVPHLRLDSSAVRSNPTFRRWSV